MVGVYGSTGPWSLPNIKSLWFDWYSNPSLQDGRHRRIHWARSLPDIKSTWFDWYSNPGLPNDRHRRIHWALAATRHYNFVV